MKVLEYKKGKALNPELDQVIQVIRVAGWVLSISFLVYKSQEIFSTFKAINVQK